MSAEKSGSVKLGYELYPDLHNARERLCRAQTHVPQWWVSDLQTALNIIDNAGSALCPEQWSRFDQPELPGGAS